MHESGWIVRRVDFGYFVRPADQTATGTPRVEALLGYAMIGKDGVLLFDTGWGQGDPAGDAVYRPVLQPSNTPCGQPRSLSKMFVGW